MLYVQHFGQVKQCYIAYSLSWCCVHCWCGRYATIGVAAPKGLTQNTRPSLKVNVQNKSSHLELNNTAQSVWSSHPWIHMNYCLGFIFVLMLRLIRIKLMYQNVYCDQLCNSWFDLLVVMKNWPTTWEHWSWLLLVHITIIFHTFFPIIFHNGAWQIHNHYITCFTSSH